MRARVRQLASILVVSATAVLVTSACGSNGGSHSTSGRVQASKGASPPASDQHEEDADTVCRLVTRADASTLFGVPATQNQGSSLAASTGACIWNATRASVRYTLIAHIYDTMAALDAAKAAGAKRVPGVGDQAYGSTAGSSGYQLWFAKDSHVGQLWFGITAPDPTSTPHGARIQRAGVLALARALAARM
jgi:hypothetical protein